MYEKRVHGFILLIHPTIYMHEYIKKVHEQYTMHLGVEGYMPYITRQAVGTIVGVSHGFSHIWFDHF